MFSARPPRGVTTILAAVWVAARLVGAQIPAPSKSEVVAPPAVVTGKITGPDKKALLEAEVLLGDTLRRLTDKKGRFEFDPVRAGMHEVLVRKIGFVPVRFRLAVTAGDVWDGTIALERTALTLPEVVVLDSSRALRNFRPRWIDDFLARRRAGIGTFLDRVEIENAQALTTASLLAHAPGISTHAGFGYDDLGVTRCGAGAGSARKGVVYVDGFKTEESMTGRFVTFMDYPPDRLSAIEVYKGASGIPSQYTDPTTCLVVLLWTTRR